ncbi:MAG: molybdopterin-dependent oxidoreductase [Oleiphilaceae bacterium]|nr:molybdopterin-dependent oxidoreductase [Oleiphilaceae bacterium]
MSETATTCPYCGVGCGVLAAAGGEGLSPVRGDPDHPANAGRLCVKGSSLHETLGARGRLLSPRVAGQRVGWEEAIQAVARGLEATQARHGRESVGFYLSGQLLTEDYYVANKLAKGFLGTPHLDTNSRLCMSSAVAGYKRAFGADAVPGCYEDIDHADLLVIAGANPAWNHPILYQRMKRARDSDPGRRVVVLDPRRNASCELADLHLPLRPGSDAILWNGLLVDLARREGLDEDYIRAHCSGFDQALAAARTSAPDTAAVARDCGLDESDVRRFYDWFRETPRTLSFYSQGINQSSSGTDKCNAIINCHLATGRVGRPGASPFSITGQPNAMGGREVGGLANQLAAHRDYDSPGAVAELQAFWRAPAMASGPGYKAVDLFEAVYRGEIRALWIMATNPLVSMPDANRVREALRRCPLVIVSDCVEDTDTLALADIVLPAAGWSEKDGTVTNSERCISRQRALLPATGEARPDWWIVSRVARAMGHKAGFDYKGPAAIFREHAALSAHNNHGQRVFDIGALATLTDEQYQQLGPVQWPLPAGGGGIGRQRLFGDGRFVTGDGRGRLLPVQPRGPQQSLSLDYPLRLNSGRLRDQWHTMTRTGRAPRLLQHRSEPFIAIHPQDLERLELSDGTLAWAHNGRGRFLGRLTATEDQRVGELFVPIHWNDQFSAEAVVSRLMAPVTDPHSGQPESKQGAVALSPFRARWQARLLCRSEPAGAWKPDYWTRVPLNHCHSWHLAGEQPVTGEDWAALAADWLGRAPEISLADPPCGRYRGAWLKGGRLEAVLLVEADNRFPDLAWLDGRFAESGLEAADRRQILAGRAAGMADTGPVVCSCFQVGETTIREAVARGCDSVSALGETLQCGTNCGSCIPELKALVSDASKAGTGGEAHSV